MKHREPLMSDVSAHPDTPLDTHKQWKIYWLFVNKMIFN